MERMSAERVLYRANNGRRQDIFNAINTARLALRKLEVQLHSNGGSRDEVKLVLAALNRLDQLETSWSW
jgi:hypothetical protein